MIISYRMARERVVQAPRETPGLMSAAAECAAAAEGEAAALWLRPVASATTRHMAVGV